LNVTKDVIFEYCHQQGISTQDAQAKSQHVVLKECPFCPKPTKGMATNLYKLYISIGGGAYMCHRCGQNGSWFDFKSELGGYQVVGGLGGTGAGTPSTNNPASTQHVHNTRGARGGGSSTPQNNTVAPLPMPQARLSACYSSLLLDAPGEGPQKANQNPSLQYLTETRGLTRATLRKYGVGRATYKFPDANGAYQATECISFPWIMRASDVHEQETLRGSQFSVVDTTTRTAAAPPPTRPAPKDDATHKPPLGKDPSMSSSSSLLDTTAEASSSSEPPPTGKFVTRRIKVRALESKAFQRLDPPGGGWGLFGLHTVPDDATSIVLTEGEYDAMAVHQATGYPAVSLPNGCRSLPLQVLPLLERFEKVYLWMDNDGPGQEGAQQFTKKIGVSRTHLVQCRDAKDANDALLQGLNLKDMIDKASVTPHEQILTFADLRQEVLHEMMHPDKYTGVPVPSLPGFTKLIKGFRRGELTVLTGPTGSGKTTFLGQVSLDLAEQGINTLWGR
jgi:twinkle protein